MSDVLLEPFGGEVLNLTVSATTKLTALFALGGLVGFAFASHVLGRGGDPYRVATTGALLGLPAFALVLLAAPVGVALLFPLGNFLIGFGGALFGHGTLTATMTRAPKNQAGLALGAWGAVQASAAGLAMALSGGIRDGVNAALDASAAFEGLGAVAGGYITVYALEIGLLLVTIAAAAPLLRRVAAGGSGAAAAAIANPRGSVR
jgi:BCD family chlorophyll transporter-like MFS transporter